MIYKTPSDLDAFIRAHDIAAELVFPPEETPTVTLAARMACAEDQIVKSVLFLIKRSEQADPVLIMTNGTAQIDFRKLAGILAVGRKRIRLAAADDVLARTGYPAGGVPPFGFDQPIQHLLIEACSNSASSMQAEATIRRYCGRRRLSLCVSPAPRSSTHARRMVEPWNVTTADTSLKPERNAAPAVASVSNREQSDQPALKPSLFDRIKGLFGKKSKSLHAMN